jgi:hypothetical protein
VCLTLASIATFTTSFAGGFPLLAASIAFTGTKSHYKGVSSRVA